MAAEANCREASRLLSISYDRALTQPEREALRFHLQRCLMCRHFESQLDFLHKAAARLREGG